MKSNFAIGCLLSALCLLCSGQLSAEGLLVQRAEWQAPLPGQSVAAIYLQLKNESSRELVLQGVDLDGARKAEFHTHSHHQGMMRMRRVDSLTLAAGETLKMAPGGLHVMAFGVTPAEGSRTLRLLLSSGAQIEVIISGAAH